MTLLNGLLALGALAFTVPLAIHLLFRSRFRTIEWGAMHLLDAVVRINRRRLQLLHLLLLLVRCMLPVLLAFCLARPLLTGFQSLPGDAAQTLILVLDDSRSMAARESSGLSRMDRVKQEIGSLLESLSRRDEVMLIRTSRIDSPPASTGSQDALRALRSLRADFGPVDLGRMVQAAVEAADQAAHAQRRIIVASDFQTHVVSDAAVASLTRLASRLEEKPIRPAISFWNLGTASDSLENLIVESIDVESPAVVKGRTASFSVELRNASDQPVRDLRLVWSIDDQSLTPSLVSIQPRSTITHRINQAIDEVGVHQLSVSIEQGDALVEDNRRSIGVDVIREIRVLLVNGDPSRQPLQGETDFLAIALSPFAFGGEDQPDAVRTQVVTPDQVERLIQSDRPDVVVLANVPDLASSAKAMLAQFVFNGGGIIVFDGDKIRPDFYNQPWTFEGESWTIPASLGDIRRTAADTSVDGDPEGKNFPVANRNPQYSPWDVLGKSEQQPFADVTVNAYRRLTISQQQWDGEHPPTLLIRLVNGDPLAVSARCGQGTVVQFAVPCDTAWTNLPTRLVYLPMLQQLVLDLAGNRKQTTIEVGQRFSVAMSELTEPLPTGAVLDPEAQPTVSVESPDGSESLLQPTEDPSSSVFVSTESGPGVYRLRQTIALQGERPQVTRSLRVVEVPAVESQLRDVDETRLIAAAEAVGGQVYTEMDQLQQDDRTRRYGREIWRWLLVGLLLAMIAEVVIQQIAVRVSTAGTV